jgi:SAM-dependent methyltransferase
MSRMGEAVLRQLVRAWKSPAAGSRDVERDWDSYIRFQYQSSPRLFSLYPGWDVRGKSVLEIGCGTGGRAAYVAASGAARVVAIDINAEEIEIARTHCPRLYPEIAGKTEYLVAKESEPLDLGQFDVVLLIDCMEHVVSPPQMLRMAHGYTAPGGRCYFSSYGWYHHLGSHTGLLPFVNVFFSDETILNVMRWWVSRPEYRPRRYDSDPPVERWRGIYNLRDRPGEHLNKLTVREMKLLARYSLFSEAAVNVVGFGRDRPLLRWLDALRHVPVIQEVYHSYVVVECRK